MQFCPCQTSTSAPIFGAFFILVLGLGFMQIDPQLTIKLLISSISPLFSTKLSPQSLVSFSKISLASFSQIVGLLIIIAFLFGFFTRK
jgi:hypothetical protein